MKSLFQKYKWMSIVFGCLLLVAGIIVFIMALIDSNSLTTSIFSIVTAIILFIIGGLTVFSSLYTEGRKPFSGSLMTGAVIIALGILLLLERALLPNAIVIYTGVLLISIAVISFIKLMMAIKFKDKKLYILLFFLVSALGATLGGLILGFQNADPLRVIIYVGLSLAIVAGGVISIVYGIKKLNKAPDKTEDDGETPTNPQQ